MMMHLLSSVLASTFLLLAVVLIHYEALRYTSQWLPRLTMPPRQRILVVLMIAFVAHAVEVLLYAVMYYVLGHYYGIGGLRGALDHRFVDYLYFSASTYSSLGFGDIYPIGELRLMAGIETIAGLMLIGWSASFTYLTMQKFWDLHGPRKG